MGFKTSKISGSATTLLVDSTATINVGSLNISNIHDTDSVNVDLYLSDDSDRYYIFKNLNIPAGAAIFVGGEEIQFARDFYSLFIKLGAAESTVDVIIRN